MNVMWNPTDALTDGQRAEVEQVLLADGVLDVLEDSVQFSRCVMAVISRHLGESRQVIRMTSCPPNEIHVQTVTGSFFFQVQRDPGDDLVVLQQSAN